MKFAIMGTGEYGSNYGSLLLRAGLDVTFIARGQRYEEIKRNGLHIQLDSQGRKTDIDHVKVTNAPAEVGPVDVVIFAVKNYHVEEAAAHVGFDPRKDVTIVKLSHPEAVRAFEGKRVDAYVAVPPFAQELRAKKLGHVVVNSTVDRPWSQYFCCVVAGHREFVQKHPVATKRALRAILKGAEMCALEPERAARSLVNKGFTGRYDYAFQAMRAVPYDKWRDYDPEDTVRFYALRLHEVGMIRSSPQKIIAQGTDWRFLNELKKELKG